MQNKKEINAGILIIGNEVLSGRTQDVNTSTLAIWLNSLGIPVAEVRVIPDDESIIINTVNELRKKYSYIFTTGGIFSIFGKEVKALYSDPKATYSGVSASTAGLQAIGSLRTPKPFSVPTTNV